MVSPTAQRQQAFTLAELLTVISIIAIIASLLLPVTSVVQNSARKTEAASNLSHLVSSVNNYYADYGQYPLNSNQIGGASYAGGTNDTVYGDPNGLYGSADLCDILRAIPDDRFNQNNALNPKAVVYLEGKDVKDANDPHDGFATKDATARTGKVKKGAYLDPWGGEYVVFVDANYDNNLDKALGWFYYTNTPAVTRGVVACSLGKDNGFGTNSPKGPDGKFAGSDDIGTW